MKGETKKNIRRDHKKGQARLQEYSWKVILSNLKNKSLKSQARLRKKRYYKIYNDTHCVRNDDFNFSP